MFRQKILLTPLSLPHMRQLLASSAGIKQGLVSVCFGAFSCMLKGKGIVLYIRTLGTWLRMDVLGEGGYVLERKKERKGIQDTVCNEREVFFVICCESDVPVD